MNTINGPSRNHGIRRLLRKFHASSLNVPRLNERPSVDRSICLSSPDPKQPERLVMLDVPRRGTLQAVWPRLLYIVHVYI